MVNTNASCEPDELTNEEIRFRTSSRIPVCQYWVCDPIQCKWWSDDLQQCGYDPDQFIEDLKIEKSLETGIPIEEIELSDEDYNKAELIPTAYPYCNRIGTYNKCNFYESSTGWEGYEHRCILPDPSRHVGRRFIPVTASGQKWFIHQINGYNRGLCNGAGTQVTCSGYAPHHMGFSAIQPDQSDHPGTADQTSFSTTEDVLEFRLPFSYEVYNMRAKLSRCYWWKDEIEEFTIDENGKISNINNPKCTNPDEMTFKYRQGYFREDEDGQYIAPCNGCKPECPGYTHWICWKYCIDDKMQHGDKILAEQVLELRYYWKKEQWVERQVLVPRPGSPMAGYPLTLYEATFAEPEICSWAGTYSQKEYEYENMSAIYWEIDGIMTYINNWGNFDVEKVKVQVSKDFPGKKPETFANLPDFPHLVRRLKKMPLGPIVRNRFDRIIRSISFKRFVLINVFETANLDQNEILLVGDCFYYNSECYAINLTSEFINNVFSSNVKDLLIEFDTMFDIKQHLDSEQPGYFDEIYTEFKNAIDFLLSAKDDNIRGSIEDINGGFAIHAKTHFGPNLILVIDIGMPDYYDFDKIEFEQWYANNIPDQYLFHIVPEEKAECVCPKQAPTDCDEPSTVSYLPGYEYDFMGYDMSLPSGCYPRHPSSVQWHYAPIINRQTFVNSDDHMASTYVDTVRLLPPSIDNLTEVEEDIEVSYKLYEHSKEEATIMDTAYVEGQSAEGFSEGDTLIYAVEAVIRHIGNSSHTWVDSELDLARVPYPWSVDHIEFVNIAEKTLEENMEQDYKGLKMSIVEAGNTSERMMPDQLFIKSNSIDAFGPICGSSALSLVGLKAYSRETVDIGSDLFRYMPFGEENFEEITESFLDEETQNIIHREDDPGFDIGVDLVTTTITGAEYEPGESLSRTSMPDQYYINKFGNVPLNIAVVGRGSTGRILSHTKVKMILWVRQPYCRDVEIAYGWKAFYNGYKLLPEYECYGQTGREYIGQKTATRFPPCGDHDLSFITGLGKMWYPYDACSDVVAYNIRGMLPEYDTHIIEVFEDPELGHGSWDMRMFGPSDNLGVTCDQHASIWACLCDWSHCNYEKFSENIFTGYARFRGGMSEEDINKCIANDGIMPKFGNVYRDFMRSFRTTDNVYYYHFVNNRFRRNRKWVPATYYFTDMDFGEASKSINNLYKLYASTDYVDDGSIYINPFGLHLLSERIEKANIEKVDIDEKMVTLNMSAEPEDSIYSEKDIYAYYAHRFTRRSFDDIFEIHSSLAGIAYPTQRDPSYKLTSGGILSPITTWYTYKDPMDISVGEEEDPKDYSTQWVWREKWRPLERPILNYENIADPLGDEIYKGAHRIIEGIELDGMIMPPYKKIATRGAGFYKAVKPIVNYASLLFLSINYPEYKYDYQTKEHRVTTSEKYHTIHLFPPQTVEDSPTAFESIYERGAYWPERYYWTLWLTHSERSEYCDKTRENDFSRCFDENMEWIDKLCVLEEAPHTAGSMAYYVNCGSERKKYNDDIADRGHFDFYNGLDEQTYVTDVTLVDSEDAEENTITIYNEYGEEEKHYYYRGLNIELDKDLYEYLPRTTQLADKKRYEIRISENSSIIDGDFDISPQWINADDNWYPGTYCFDIGGLAYDHEFTSDMSLEFRIMDRFGMHSHASIRYITIDYLFGAKSTEEPFDGVEFIGDLYHLPGINIYKITFDQVRVYSIKTSNIIYNESKRNTFYSPMYSNNNTYLSWKNDDLETLKCVYEVGAGKDLTDILYGETFIRIDFRFLPTEEEILSRFLDGKDRYNLSTHRNLARIQCIKLYFDEFQEAVENVYTWERKYVTSVGRHGDIPPHGTDDTGSLLYPLEFDRSSVYQRDSEDGLIIGQPTSLEEDGEDGGGGGAAGEDEEEIDTAGKLLSHNKLRGRTMFECHEDKERVPGINLEDYEKKQKEIHDAIVKSGETSIEFGRLDTSTETDFERYLIKPAIECYYGGFFHYWSDDFLLVNKLVRLLSSMISRDSYSGCGHFFDWDFSNTSRQVCGHRGTVFGRTYENTFEYVFRHACSGYEAGYIDAVTAYYRGGAGSLFINPAQYVGAQSAASWQKEQSLRRSAVLDTYTSSVPEQANPFF